MLFQQQNSKSLPIMKQQQAESQLQDKCVCQICQCGEHKCPRPGPDIIKFQGTTTNQDLYKPHYNVSPEKSFSPPRQPVSNRYEEDDLNTTYRKVYSPPKKQSYVQIPPKSSRRWADYKPDKVNKFEGITQYKSKYEQKPISPDNSFKAVKKNKQTLSPAKFQGYTTYTQQFSPKKISPENCRNRRKKNDESPTNRSPSPFKGNTTYQETYLPHKIQQIKKQSFSPVPKELKPAIFEGESNYKSSYRAYEQYRKCPISNLPRRPKQCSPGKKHLNYSPQKGNWI